MRRRVSDAARIAKPDPHPDLSVERGGARDALNKYPRSQCLRSAFTRPNAHRFFDLGYKDFAIADLPCFGRSQNCLDSPLCAIVWKNHLEFYLRKKINGVLCAAINFAVSLLSAKSFDLAERHSFHACCHQGFLHRLCFKRLDDRLDLFHRAKTRTGAPNGKQSDSNDRIGFLFFIRPWLSPMASRLQFYAMIFAFLQKNLCSRDEG